MAMNVNQITAQLARLPDQALRSVAQMHKSDPYIMALVAGESARRKEIRTAATPQAPGMQPTVADQLIASLPEDQGIARLPMQTEFAANGGIVGYADRGLVDGSAVDITGLSDDARLRRQTGPYGATEPVITTSRPTADEPAEGSWLMQGLRKIKEEISPPKDPRAAMRGRRSDAESVNERLNQRIADEERTAGRIPVISTTEAAAAASADADAAARLAKLEQGYNAGRGAGRVATSLLQPQIKPDAIMAQYRVSPTESVSRLENLRSESEAALRLAAKEREQGIAALGKYGEDELKRLRADEAKAPEEGKRAIYEAMIVAGLGMMGSQSQYALQGIAEGAMKGFGAYKGAMKDLKDAANERRKTMMTIEQMRRAEARGDVDRSYELQKALAQNHEKYGEKIIGVIAHADDVNAKMAFDITLAAMKENRADARVQYEMAARAALQKSQGPDFAFYRYLASKDPAAAKIYMEQVEAWSGAKRAPGEMSAAQLITSRSKLPLDVQQAIGSDPTYAAKVDAAIMSGSPIPPYQPKVLGGTQSSK